MLLTTICNRNCIVMRSSQYDSRFLTKTLRAMKLSQIRKPSLHWKIFLAMKITAFIMLAISVQVAASGVSQTVTFTGKDVPLEQIFGAIKKQTGYLVYYTSNQIKNTKTGNTRSA